ncbi:MAG: PA14 domain-containing protein [Opitutaceae bacterium]
MSLPSISSKRPRKKINSQLLSVIVISGVIHLAVIIILGGITVVEYMTATEAEFEAPDPIVEEQPPPEVKITIPPKKPDVNPQPLKLQAVAEISVDNITVDLPSMADSFTVSDGLGNGGGGSGMDFGSFGKETATRFPDIKGFGTTEKVEHAWEGTVHLFKDKGIKALLEEGGDKVVGLRAGRRQGKEIYNYVLNIPEQDFSNGFPGVTDQFEWFAIDFEVALQWPPELAGDYEFQVSSDDGAVLLIDRDLVVDNDKTHGMQTATGKYTLEMGIRKFRLAYFQGPATRLGLILKYRKVGESQWKLFDTKEFIKYQL